jgi:hypothetical protein
MNGLLELGTHQIAYQTFHGNVRSPAVRTAMALPTSIAAREHRLAQGHDYTLIIINAARLS